jgi:subtilisin family serine protease
MRKRINISISLLTCIILWFTAAAAATLKNDNETVNQQQQQQQQGRRSLRSRYARSTSSQTQTHTQRELYDLPHEIDATRVIVQCQDVWTMATCLEEILRLIPSVVIIHQLDVLHAIAIAIQLPPPFNMNTNMNMNNIQTYMNDLSLDMQPDPTREPLHLEHSLRILQADLNTQQIIPYGLELLAVPQVWSQTRGAGVKVCIMDTGVDLPHPDLLSIRMSGSDSKDVVRPWTQDASGHGTHVTGTIGAADNGVGIMGVAPDADLFIVRVFNYNGVFRGSDVIAAAEQCRLGGATVINMSLGGTSPVTNERKLFKRYFDQDGIVAVAAAGNSGHQGNAVNYPAGYPEVLSVAAVNQQGQVAYFSTRNDMVNVAAPGVAVHSTYKGGQYAKLSGTSMASPHVAGVVALLQSAKPQATPLEIWQVLIGTASLSSAGGAAGGTNGNANSRTPELGHGLVNVLAAMNAWFPPEEEEVVDTNPPTTVATNPPTTVDTNPPTTVATNPPTTVATNPPTTVATNPPTTVATNPPTNAATNPPTSSTTPVCGAGKRSFVISINTDRYGYVP